MTKFKLLSLLTATVPVTTTINGITGIVFSIGREDGSGSCFNVTIATKSGYKTTFVRTID